MKVSTEHDYLANETRIVFCVSDAELREWQGNSRVANVAINGCTNDPVGDALFLLRALHRARVFRSSPIQKVNVDVIDESTPSLPPSP